jgi:putative DNA primase/helicase
MKQERSIVLSTELNGRYNQEWLIEKIIPKNATTLGFGDEDSYKTFTALNIAFQINNGFQEIAKTIQTGVLYLCLENENGFEERIDAIHSKYPSAIPLKISFDTFDIQDQEDVYDLCRYCIDNEVGFVVIDTLSRAIHHGDESQANVAREVRNAFSILNANGISVLCIHHSGKNASSGARGSSIITYDIPSRYLVKKLTGNKGVMQIVKTKSDNSNKKIPFVVEVCDKSLNVIWNQESISKLSNQILEIVNENLYKVSDLKKDLAGLYKDIKIDSFSKKVNREIGKLVNEGIVEESLTDKVKFIRRTK